MRLITLKRFSRADPQVTASAIATNELFNDRSVHKRCLQAWAAVLRWASIAECDRVEFSLAEDDVFRFFDGTNRKEVSEVSFPSRQIRQQIFQNLIYAYSPFRMLPIRIGDSFLSFFKNFSGTFVVDDVPSSKWKVEISCRSAIFSQLDKKIETRSDDDDE